MAVRVSLVRFPEDRDVLESSGLPWGVTLTPFASVDENGRSPVYGSDGQLLPRCKKCYGYFSTYCDHDRLTWNCSLCGAANRLNSEVISRFSEHTNHPEMMSTFIDLQLRLEPGEAELTNACPVYVAAVDLYSSEEFLELTKSSLQATLEALPSGSLFGLSTFSHKMGLYDVQGAIPVLKNVFILSDADSSLPIKLENVMPLLHFLAPIETCKDRITNALDTLRPKTSWEKASGSAQGRALMGGRGFGVAMESLLKYLGSEYGNVFSTARVFAFISGPPDYGAGHLDKRRFDASQLDAATKLLPQQTPFYKNLAAVAVQAGVCVDIFAVTNEYTDLASLKFLCIESGGSLFLYPNTEDSTLPQDMYRMLARPYAFGCVLKLRASSQYQIGNSYGHFFPDPEYENVQHILCCDSYATFAYDFHYGTSAGFFETYAYSFEFAVDSHGFYRQPKQPILQIAFQYSTIVPSESNLSHPERRFELQRRLRIRTMQFRVTRDINDLYDAVDAEVVVALLVQKVIEISLEKGVREGRLLLREWLVIFTALYNIVRFGKSGGPVDVAFSHCPQLQPLPRLVFALLRNPLLRLHEEGIHPDHRIYLQCLFSALQPSFLSRAVYPLLSSYSNPDEVAYPRHSLSRAALITSGSPIFLLDAFTVLIVFYCAAAADSLPFPPPQDCGLRSTINKLKRERSVTPKLLFIREGQDDATPFETYLIEEQDVDGSGYGFRHVLGFVSFLEEITRSVVEYMK